MALKTIERDPIRDMPFLLTYGVEAFTLVEIGA